MPSGNLVKAAAVSANGVLYTELSAVSRKEAREEKVSFKEIMAKVIPEKKKSEAEIDQEDKNSE